MEPVVAVALAWLLLPFLFLFFWLRARRRAKANLGLATDAQERLSSLEQRFQPVLSLEQEVQRITAEVAIKEAEIQQVRRSYNEKRKLLTDLEKKVAIFDETLAFAELGLYEPHFEFGDSEVFKREIKAVRDRQKSMVTAKTATICPTDWQVEGSRSKGQTMINRQMRLTMRAFNNECDAAVSNTRWNNVVAMEKRVLNAAKQINAANTSLNLEISDDYVALKLDELHLTHEYREQQKIEKEERAELARAEREEKKLLAEAAAAERREAQFQQMLDKARLEVGADQSRIAELEAQLTEAHAATERARAMAEMTKSGYVYVISNIGSFGKDVVKIGLTRRLDPNDRVKELGDASVPFGFDVHAMIYSEEAPALESALHREFADRRINMSNMRKEFFRVELEEVEEAVARLAPESSFFKDREAQEWHETLARRRDTLEQLRAEANAALPAAI